MITSPDLAALILLWSAQDRADCRGILQVGGAGMGTAIRFGIMNNNNNSSQSFPVPSCSNNVDDNNNSQSFPVPMAAPAKKAASSKKAAKKVAVVADLDCPFYFRPVVAQEESGMSDLEAGSMGFR